MMAVKGTQVSLESSTRYLLRSFLESAKQGSLSAIATTETNPDKVCNFPTSDFWGASGANFVKSKGQASHQ